MTSRSMRAVDGLTLNDGGSPARRPITIPRGAARAHRFFGCSCLSPPHIPHRRLRFVVRIVMGKRSPEGVLRHRFKNSLKSARKIHLKNVAKIPPFDPNCSAHEACVRLRAEKSADDSRLKLEVMRKRMLVLNVISKRMNHVIWKTSKPT